MESCPQSWMFGAEHQHKQAFARHFFKHAHLHIVKTYIKCQLYNLYSFIHHLFDAHAHRTSPKMEGIMCLLEECIHAF